MLERLDVATGEASSKCAATGPYTRRGLIDSVREPSLIRR